MKISVVIPSMGVKAKSSSQNHSSVTQLLNDNNLMCAGPIGMRNKSNEGSC